MTTPRPFSMLNDFAHRSRDPLAMHALQRLANHVLGAEAHAVEVLQHAHDLAGLVTEREQRAVAPRLRPASARATPRRRAPSDSGKRSAISSSSRSAGLAADAGDLREAHEILVAHALIEPFDAHARQHAERDARPDVRDLQQAAEQRALGLGEEAEQDVRVLAHDEMRDERQRLARIGQPIERRHRRLELVADAADVERQRRRPLRDQGAS